MVTLGLQAQETKEQYLQAAAEHTCDCIATKSDDEATPLEIKLGTCMVGFMLDDAPRYEKLFGELNLNDQQSMMRIGEQLGVVMLSECPAVMMQLVGETGEGEDAPEDLGEVTGQIADVTNDRLSLLKFKTENGPELEFLWLEHFEGAELLQASDATGARFKVVYELRDIFNGKTEAYEPCRVIVSLERM